MSKIRKWFRIKYILFRYKHNYKSGKLIYLKSSDRRFGLTTELIKESIEKGIPILVHNNNAKRYIAHEMYKRGQLLLAPCVTEQYAMEKLLITPTDNLRGRGINWILVDNGCTESDVVKLLDNNYPIASMNGYITSYLMA